MVIDQNRGVKKTTPPCAETRTAPRAIDAAVTWVGKNLDQLVPPILPGDANEDGVINSADLDLVRANWGQSGEPGQIPTDLKFDGTFKSGDLDLVRANCGNRASGEGIAGVPEPGAMLLLGLGIGMVLLFRRVDQPHSISG